MKRILMSFLIMLAIVFTGQAQEKLKVGEVKNGKLVITNQPALQAFLMNCVGKSGSLGKDFKVSASPDGTRFVVSYPVSGNQDKVSSAAVMLVVDKKDVNIVTNPPNYSPGGPGGGGSATVTCSGNPCETCYPDIQWISGRWLPIIVCKCQDPAGFCNMIISITFSINITS